MNTLLFQNIPKQTTITTGTGGKYVKRPKNASGWQRNHIYQVGRDKQMVGNLDPKSAKPPYPICPYHMPTNSDRYNDPSLHVPYKKVKDLIELKDINRLIERITLFTHLWNAEANDINSKGIRSKIRSKVLSNLKPIGTTQEAATAPVLTYRKNTIRQNSPYIRIVDLSQAEYNSLDHSLFAPTSFLNNNQKMKDSPVGENSAITLPDTRQGKIQSSGNPVIFHCGQERLYRVTTYLDDNHNLVLAYHDEEIIAANANGLEGYNKNVQENIHFESRSIGNITINNQKYFVITYRTNDKTALKPELRYIVMKLWFYDNSLKTFNAAPIVETRESDWSIQEQFKNKRGKHPIIAAREFVQIQQTLDRLINALTDLSSIVLGGVTDSVTKTNVSNFKMSHVPYQTSFDKDDPDTNFYNYQAQPQAIIKVGFYNTLVDAYKLLINSCMCNCDCACNSDCVCNTNCGCNYGK